MGSSPESDPCSNSSASTMLPSPLPESSYYVVFTKANLPSAPYASKTTLRPLSGTLSSLHNQSFSRTLLCIENICTRVGCATFCASDARVKVPCRTTSQKISKLMDFHFAPPIPAKEIPVEIIGVSYFTSDRRSNNMRGIGNSVRERTFLWLPKVQYGRLLPYNHFSNTWFATDQDNFELVGEDISTDHSSQSLHQEH